MVSEQVVKTTNSQEEDVLLMRFMDRASELQDALSALLLVTDLLADKGYAANVALVQERDRGRAWLKTVTHWNPDSEPNPSVFSVNCEVGKLFVEFVPLEEEDDIDELPF